MLNFFMIAYNPRGINLINLIVSIGIVFFAMMIFSIFDFTFTKMIVYCLSILIFAYVLFICTVINDSISESGIWIFVVFPLTCFGLSLLFGDDLFSRWQQETIQENFYIHSFSAYRTEYYNALQSNFWNFWVNSNFIDYAIVHWPYKIALSTIFGAVMYSLFLIEAWVFETFGNGFSLNN